MSENNKTLNDLRFVILAAGSGTRNYPHSKGQVHKSLLPFGSMRMLDETLRCINEISYNGRPKVTMVVSNSEVEKYFLEALKKDEKVENKFKNNGRENQAKLLSKLSILDKIDLSFVYQETPKGVGQAIGLVRNKFSNENIPFFTIFSDDFIFPKIGINFSTYKQPITRMAERYISEGCKGNLYFTKVVNNPERWGIIDKGYITEKPTHLKTGEASFVGFILDKEVISDLGAAAENVEIKGTEEYNRWNSEGKEIYQMPYINSAVEKDFEKMAIRTEVLKKEEEILMDGGSLEGYEKVLLQTLLTSSINKEENIEFAKIVLNELNK